MKVLRFFMVLLFSVTSYGQIVNSNRVSKTILSSKDTLYIENVSISPVNFIVKDSTNHTVPKTSYQINFSTAGFYYPTTTPKKITISYYKYPEALTKTYSPFNEKLIIPKATATSPTYSIKKDYTKNDFFGGIQTYGNITRGITVGNNQGSVLNSGLDLQITGNLSDNLKLRASIKDTNVPIQENGISQNINEFDRVFIELFTNQWKLKAGDVDIVNSQSYFLNFNKKINGAALDVVLDNGSEKTTITASGALAKGRFATQNINAQEGNQGPYQLLGINNETNIVVISASETVFVNGIPLKRGEQYDYTIDYTTAEIIFNPTFPINASQRIIVDFQYSDQNYNRFVTYNGIQYQKEKFSFGTFFYNENDVKNQPLQQSLNDDQKKILQQAGNDTSKMVAPSAQVASFDANRIQYSKDTNGNFVHSTDDNDTVYNVVFSPVSSGDYDLLQATALGNIYEYKGPGLGNYAPITQLFAPTKTQMAVINSRYKTGKKSYIHSEIAYSLNDQNLFSDKDDSQNNGIATTVTWQQQITDNKWISYNTFNADFVQKNFNNIEGLYQPEFNRDWNIDPNVNPNFLGNQTFLYNTISLEKTNYHAINFYNAYLNLGNVFDGYKSDLQTKHQLKNTKLSTKTSYLNSKNSQDKGKFLRHQTHLTHPLKKAWLEGLLDYENNQQKNKVTQVFNNNSQKYFSAGSSIGLGDSTQVYVKLGFSVTQLDSIKNNQFARVQNIQNYTITSQPIKNKNSSLNTFVNYRKSERFFAENLEIVNARILYQQQLFNRLLQLATTYETSSGNTPQQNFTYIETEPGQGFYTYLGDLNNNGLKDFDEFEIAQFTDQANYLRVILPNINRVATQKAKFSQSVFVDFLRYQHQNNKWLKGLSHFSNQASILINKDQLKQGKKFNSNPFDTSNEAVISLQQTIFNSLYFNRGLQNFSTTYTYQKNKNTQNIALDVQQTKTISHELNFLHNLHHSWLLGWVTNFKKNQSISKAFSNRNFNITSQSIKPFVTFLKDEFSTFTTNYTYRNEANTLGNEAIVSHNFGLEFNYNHLNKGSVIANVHWIENNFKGATNTPASYRILEGLQTGRNYLWSLIVQKKITKLLDLSVNYNGRKNKLSNTIHIGSVQLRANF